VAFGDDVARLERLPLLRHRVDQVLLRDPVGRVAHPEVVRDGHLRHVHVVFAAAELRPHLPVRPHPRRLRIADRVPRRDTPSDPGAPGGAISD
jgi:hypothetical protein